MSWTYLACPFFAFIVAGCLKFLINSIKTKSFAFGQMGLGGLPSTHTSIVSSVAMLIGLRQGFTTAAFAIMLTLVMIVIIDALDLRRKVGEHAVVLKKLFPDHPLTMGLREKIGHNYLEIIFGLVTGAGCGLALYFF